MYTISHVDEYTHIWNTTVTLASLQPSKQQSVFSYRIDKQKELISIYWKAQNFNGIEISLVILQLFVHFHCKTYILQQKEAKVTY